MSWSNVHSLRWVRCDGAVVMWNHRSPWPNPAKDSARMWTAWEPEPSQNYIAVHRGRYRRCVDGVNRKPSFPRRFKTAEAAMKCVDQLHPVNLSTESPLHPDPPQDQQQT